MACISLAILEANTIKTIETTHPISPIYKKGKTCAKMRPMLVLTMRTGMVMLTM